jgi:Domain of unknown function (DUF4136)
MPEATAGPAAAMRAAVRVDDRMRLLQNYATMALRGQWEGSVRYTLSSLVILACLLAGCQQVHSNVTRFSEMPAVGHGTFVIVPLKAQEGSLEFQTYAANTGRHLQLHGYQLVTDTRQADFAVFLSYAVHNPQTVPGVISLYDQTTGGYNRETGSFTISGAYGRTYGTYSGSTYTAPTYIPYSRHNYTRVLLMNLVDLHKSTPTQLHTSFEGRVISSGSHRFEVVAGCLIDAMFDGFPGSNGETKMVQISLDSCSK